MGHSYVSALFHVVFSTKDRERTIAPAWRPRLWAYLGGIARTNQMKALGVGGTEDHLHVLLSLPATLAVAKGVQLIKGGSSKWAHDTFGRKTGFEWQEGYGAFSIGVSQAPETLRYIEGQELHHRKMSYREELLAFLKKHGIPFDEHDHWD